MLILASFLALILLAAMYAIACAVTPFRPSGKLRYGRRALNAWRRAHDAGTR